MNISEKALKIAEALDSKKGQDIRIIYVADKTIISEYFVIASASSSTLVHTLADIVEEKTAEAGYPPMRMEGVSEARWVVMDFGDVLVHIFHNEEREFYQLERLWEGEKNSIKFEDLRKEEAIK